jgi:hypothetical protein
VYNSLISDSFFLDMNTYQLMLKRGRLRDLIEDAGLSVEEFVELL